MVAKTGMSPKEDFYANFNQYKVLKTAASVSASNLREARNNPNSDPRLVAQFESQSEKAQNAYNVSSTKTNEAELRLGRYCEANLNAALGKFSAIG